MPTERHRCRVCDADGLTLRKRSDVVTLTATDFAISDAHYGRTAAVYECGACGFVQCPELGEVVSYYKDLEDAAYEASRHARRIQARRLLRRLRRLLKRDLRGLRLLDVGTGSGPLLEEAAALGLEAEGVEPSIWLCARATERGLTVHNGVLPHSDIRGAFDLVTMIDVIEHVPDPGRVLREAALTTKPDGVVVLVTPDVASLAARLMGWRWWHFRVAHIGYFSRPTLERLCKRAGLTLFASSRPGWALPLSYLMERVNRYLPASVRFSPARWMSLVIIPFNLHDSMMLCARRAPDSESATARAPEAR